MGLEHVERFAEARKKWPNQPLVVFEAAGDMEFIPIGGRLTSFSTITVVGIINADDSAVVQEKL
jgi:hypothetical protein